MTERRTMLPGSRDDPYILEPAEDKAPYVGRYEDDTEGDTDWFCSGCGTTLFRQFAPDGSIDGPVVPVRVRTDQSVS